MADGMNPKCNARFAKAKSWRDEGRQLRAVLCACDLREEIKWRQPCYTHGGKNIVIIQRMKDFVALAFFKGALLKDPKRVLRSQGPNSRHARRIEFTSAGQIRRLAPTIKAYVREAIAVEQAGRKVPKAPALVLAKELAERLAKDRGLKKAFDALTPGRRREYNLYVSGAKQATTRVARVERCVPKIRAGKGFRE